MTEIPNYATSYTSVLPTTGQSNDSQNLPNNASPNTADGRTPDTSTALSSSNNDVAVSRVWMLNVQSINPSANSRCRWKLPYLKKKLAKKSENIPFIALTETWLKPYITDAMVDIEGYNGFRSDCSIMTGGGVLVYCHERIPITNV